VSLATALRRLAPRKLTARTMVRIAGGVAAVIVAAAITSYVVMFREIEQRSRKELADHVSSRVQVEGQRFTLARDVQQVIVKIALDRHARYRDAGTVERFDRIFERRDDGSVRVRRETYTAESPTTGWLRRGVPLTDELKARMVLFFDLVEQFKPVLGVRLEDIFFTAPEPLNIGTDPPGLALWAETIPADFDQNAEPWVSIAGPAENPSRRTVYMGAEFDPVWKKLVSGIATPIYLGDRHLGTVHNDVLIDTLVANLRRSQVAGARQFLLSADGRLIASADGLEPVEAPDRFRLEESADPRLRALWTMVKSNPPLPFVGHDPDTDQYVAFDRVDGPGWYFATALPGELIRGQAFAVAQWVLWIGLLSLALVLAVLTWVLRRSVARPLHALISATQRMAAGDFRQELRPAAADELTQLANSFNDMMHRIGERDALLVREKAELQEALEKLRANEVELQRQQAALIQSEKLAAMGSLLAGVAHELNNPLFVVSGRAMMLESSAAGSPHAQLARKIRAAAERCARIVKTFLAMARQNRPQHASVQLTKVVRSCLDVLDYTLQSAGVVVDVDSEAGLPAVLGDEDQLHQVLLNLFVNAQQAMSGHDGRRVLRVRLRRAEGGVEVRVSDSGPGVPPDIRAKIFDPYFTTKPMGVGTGVGLSVCLGIVQAHGGTLRLDTESAGGAAFVITLPAAGRERAAAPAPRAQSNRPSFRILIVDDEPEVRETLRDMLELAGHEVLACGGGEEALELLETETVDSVVSDLRMPGLDGVGLYRAIAARWPALRSRVIFMTGDGLNANHAAFLAELTPRCLEKPFSPEELSIAIAEMSGERRIAAS
jgi:C4-dicarboxylate-specific signal transduction histidine kinase/CheY-like chemotaxis protein